MKTLINESYFGRVDFFEEVKEFPEGYQIWSIGRHNFKHEGYIPLCEADNDFRVNMRTLKTLNVGDEQLALLLLKKAIKSEVDKTAFNKICKNYEQH